jgi:tetrapyrrole methylase family protein / MazG family protein
VRANVVVVGLGPAGPELLGDDTRRLVAGAGAAFLRTARHPSAGALGDVPSFDQHYEEAATFDEVYDRIVADLVTAAQVLATDGGSVVYAVPGSPLVGERTVELLRADRRVEVTVVPALSFLDLAWARLGVDPVTAGVRLVDGQRFAEEAAGERGPLLVAQCWSRDVLSEMKLALDAAGPADVPAVTVLHHLGLPDEVVATVPWPELDRAVAPDHLTSVWVPRLASPVAAEMVALDELVRRLRRDCPWDRQQTHATLSGHLLEECYEVIDAIDVLSRVEAAPLSAGTPDADTTTSAVLHLEEELGDLLFHVYFHSRLAAEQGRFTLADVAHGVHDKLVARHPHVFGDVEAHDAATVLANWEEIKLAEKGRTSVADGIPDALPALATATKLQRKASAVPGLAVPSTDELRERAASGVEVLAAAARDAATAESDEAGEVLWAVADLVRRSGVDPEGALRSAARRFRARVTDAEVHAERGRGSPVDDGLTDRRRSSG